MIIYDKLTEKQKLELKNGVIEVSGRHMNRTALGIVDAVTQLYPSATFEDLKLLLPDSINPAAPKNYRSLFNPYSERMYGVIQPGSIRKECQEQELDINASHFTEEGEIFKSSDGIEVLVSKSWESKDTETGEHDLENLIQHVEKYGVRVVEYQKEKSFKKGGYSLEIINPALLNQLINPKKKSFPYWVLFIGLLLAGILGFFLLKACNKETTVIKKPNVEAVKSKPIDKPKDAIAQLKEDVKAGKNVENRVISFNAIFFEFDSDKIKDSSLSDLKLALDLLNELPDLAIEINGHTSNEGKEIHNLQLSQKRAQAVKTWLVSNGITESRLTSVGKGSTESISPNDTEENKEKNRRIEFVIVKNNI
jgi:outer membrane protein OmpA-like peptidoglycan-associated protein